MRTTPPRLKKVAGRKRLIRSSDLAAAGIPRVQMSRWVNAGVAERVVRGLYSLPDRTPSEHAGIVTVAHKAPRAVFCLLSALRLHGLTTQAPFEVWIAIKNSDKPPRLSYPPLRVVRFSPQSLEAGVEVLTVDDTPVRTTSVAKTVADCFKFRNKIGLDVALEALREARKTKRASPDELWRYARLCRVANVMRPYLEAIG